jgi:two-component system sensor histidine kinase MprB
MPLRKRVSLAAAVAVAAAVALAMLASYLVVRNQLLGQVDTELKAQASTIQHGDYHALDQRLPGLPASAGGPAPYVQIVLPNGSHTPVLGGIKLPEVHQAAGRPRPS